MKEDTTITEAKRKIAILENGISKLLREFQEETGLSITNVRLCSSAELSSMEYKVHSAELEVTF